MERRAGSRWSAAVVALLVCLCAAGVQAQSWYSSLYPPDWQPGHRAGDGSFLHDFSFAGYHRGERPLPDMTDLDLPVFDVTLQPFVADPTGSRDSTAAIQEAIDVAGAAGGGVVMLPAGIYRVRPPSEDALAALIVRHSGVVVRGAGRDRTFLVNDSTEMRARNVIRLAPMDVQGRSFTWYESDGRPAIELAEDGRVRERHLELVHTEGLSVGDWVVVRCDASDDFIAEHGMEGIWRPEGVRGLVFYRRVTSVDEVRGIVGIDIPLRYPVLIRDSARLERCLPHISEVGVEDLAIGMVEVYGDSLGDEAWDLPGTAAYEVHASAAVEFNHVVDGWLRRVVSFRPEGNQHAHFLSNGVRLSFARSITLHEVEMQSSQYHGEGGNGNHFMIQGSDNLLTSCTSAEARHNYSIGLIVATGNVLHRCRAAHGRLPVDFHMHLSPANLIDSMVLDDDTISAVRRRHAGHGHGTTQSVVWNAAGTTTGWEVDLGLKVLVETGQYGWGLVIGTSGSDHRVRHDADALSLPLDVVEGEGRGGDLVPASLYDSMLDRRLARIAGRRLRGRAQP